MDGLSAGGCCYWSHLIAIKWTKEKERLNVYKNNRLTSSRRKNKTNKTKNSKENFLLCSYLDLSGHNATLGVSPPTTKHNPTHNPKHNLTHNPTLEHNSIQFSILICQPTTDAQNNLKNYHAAKKQRQECCIFCSCIFSRTKLRFFFSCLTSSGREWGQSWMPPPPETPPTFEEACSTGCHCKFTWQHLDIVTIAFQILFAIIDINLCRAQHFVQILDILHKTRVRITAKQNQSNIIIYTIYDIVNNIEFCFSFYISCTLQNKGNTNLSMWRRVLEKEFL